jgi:hypothetical protein
MILLQEKQEKLRAIFAALPQSSVNALGAAFHSAIENQDNSLPFDVLADLLPDQKKLSQKELKNLFFPVSELLAAEQVRSDQISEELLQKLWSFYRAEFQPVLAKDWKLSNQSLRKVRVAIASGLRDVWEAEGGRDRLLAHCGAHNKKRIPMLISILSFADEIGELVSSWPAKINDLNDQVLLPLRDLDDLLSELDPDITPYLLFLLKQRLIHPQHILRAVQKLSRQSSDRVIVNTDMNTIVECLLDEAEVLLENSLKPMRDDEHAREIARMMDRFSNIIHGSTEEFDISNKSSWGKRLYGLSGKAVQLWTNRLKAAWKILDLAMPRAKTKSFLGGSLSGSDLRQSLPKELVHDAADAACLLGQVFPFANRFGISSSRDKFGKLIEDRIYQTENELVALISDPGETDLEILHSHFSTLVGIVSKYQGEDMATILSRRGIAAAA